MIYFSLVVVCLMVLSFCTGIAVGVLFLCRGWVKRMVDRASEKYYGSKSCVTVENLTDSAREALEALIKEQTRSHSGDYPQVKIIRKAPGLLGLAKPDGPDKTESPHDSKSPTPRYGDLR